MTGILLLLPFLLQPSEPMAGVYCDDVAIELIAYNEERGVWTDEQLQGLIGDCEVWEEEYEDAVEAGEVEPINN